jgi:hypothetical protein
LELPHPFGGPLSNNLPASRALAKQEPLYLGTTAVLLLYTLVVFHNGELYQVSGGNIVRCRVDTEVLS